MEKQRRIIGIDYFRSIMILLIVIYHIWVITGQSSILSESGMVFIRLGGEIGVTGFFALSGFGIYRCIDSQVKKGKISYFQFMKDRIKKLYPQYIFCLLFSVLFMDGAYYLSKDGALNLISHFVFLHNINPYYVGAINGVLWTMALIVQFYVISIPMYKLIKKGGFISTIIFIGITVVSKFCIYYYVLSNMGLQGTQNFYAGRQLLISVIDNFALGMFLAYLIYEKKWRMSSKFGMIIGCISVVGVYGVSVLGLKYGIHTNNYSGYLWHSMIAIVLFLQMWGMSSIELGSNNYLHKFLMLISKNEYGIYLWHLLLITNLTAKTQITSYMRGMRSTLAVYLLLIVLVCTVGVVMTCVFSNVNYLKKDKGN